MPHFDKQNGAQGSAITSSDTVSLPIEKQHLPPERVQKTKTSLDVDLQMIPYTWHYNSSRQQIMPHSNK